MKTLNNLSTGKFDTLEIGAVTICSSTLSQEWKWTLPPNDGDADQVLSTDGNGVTTWTTNTGEPGTVTAIGFSVTNQFSVSGPNPIEDSGTFGLSLNNPSGTGDRLVLSNGPTLTGVTNTEQINLIFAGSGNKMFIGHALANNQSLLVGWTGTSDSLTNSFNLGFFGGITGTKFVANGDVELTPSGNLILSNSTDTTTIKNHDTSTTSWIFELPEDAGTSGQFLKTNGVGMAATWEIPPSIADPLPVSNGGTGVTSSTGSGNTVLSDAPAFTGLITNLENTGSRPSGQLWDIFVYGNRMNNALAGRLRFFEEGDSSVTNYWSMEMWGSDHALKGFWNGKLQYKGDVEILEGNFVLQGSTFKTTIVNAAAAADWTLTLPQNNGSSGQVLATDGLGVTSWVAQTGSGAGTGTVTSVGYAVDTNYLSLSGTESPIEDNGAFTIGLNSPVGTGKIVLDVMPTLTTPTLTTPILNGSTDCQFLQMRNPGGGLRMNETELLFTGLNGSGIKYDGRLEIRAFANPGALEFNSTTTATWDASGFHSPIQLKADSTVRTVQPLWAVNTASDAAQEIELVAFEAPNAGDGSFLKSRMGKNQGHPNNHCNTTFFYEGDQNGGNSTKISIGTSDLEMFADSRATKLNTKLSFSGNEGFDYDEGTWTPTLKYFDKATLSVVNPSATLTNVIANGAYIRHGRMVTVFFDYLFDQDVGDALGNVGNRWVLIGGVPFTCNSSFGASKFSARGLCSESSYPNGIAAAGVKAPLASTYSDPFEPTIWGVDEVVGFAIQTAVAPSVFNWTSDGNHIPIFAENTFDSSTIILPGPTFGSNQGVSNFNILTTGGMYNGNRFKGTLTYFIS